MAPIEDVNSKKKAAKNKLKKGSDDDDDREDRDRKQSKAVKKKGKGSDVEEPGGTWQQFVAWVPNGAALMNPEPWKPLSNQTMAAVAKGSGDQGVAIKSAKSFQPSQAPALHTHGVVPGAVHSFSDAEHSDDESDITELGNQKDKLELMPIWKPTEKEKSANRRGTVGSEDIDQMSCSRSEADPDEDQADDSTKRKFVINPDSNIRIVWDLSSLFMVIYDMIMIPMAVFTMPNHPFLVAMDWTTRLFWTVDMGWSCCTGVVLADGTVEYSMNFILKRYCKSWLALDILIVGSDWSGVVLSSSGGMEVTRLARVSRVFRVVRLLRLVRMQEVIANITERIQSDKMILLLQILKLLIFLIGSCHVTACGWWGVGDIASGRSWIKQYGYRDQDVGLQYLVSLHWSLSQFSGGLEEFAPTGIGERFYTVLIWVISFLSGLVMLSFLTSSLTQQYIIGGTGARQMAVLRKYLGQNRVPKNLIKRLCRSAKHAISGDLQPDSVDLLHVVSEPLKIEMHFEMYSKVITRHPFFGDFLREADQVMRRICHTCTSMLLLDTGDVIFRRGDESGDPRMYFVFSGEFTYLDKYSELRAVGEGQWLSEPALWTNWKHQGTLKAASNGKMVVIEADQFQEVCVKHVKKSKGIGFNPKVYAAKFIEELNASGEWTDLGNSGRP